MVWAIEYNTEPEVSKRQAYNLKRILKVRFKL